MRGEVEDLKRYLLYIMTDLTRRGRGRGRKGRTDDVDRIRSEEDKRRKGGGETRCG